MKTLHLRRHSIKDGPSDTIGPQGLELARIEGIKSPTGPDGYDKAFHGPLVRTAQTLLGFLMGLAVRLGYTSNLPKIMPVVFGLGDADLFAAIATPEFKGAVKCGASNFEAVRIAHGEAKLVEWARLAYNAVKTMFTQLEDGETGLGFFHSPTIEMAAWFLDRRVPDDMLKLSDLEGLVFVQDGAGIMAVTGKISVAPLETK